jgi:hypothetical protein
LSSAKAKYALHPRTNAPTWVAILFERTTGFGTGQLFDALAKVLQGLAGDAPPHLAVTGDAVGEAQEFSVLGRHDAGLARVEAQVKPVVEKPSGEIEHGAGFGFGRGEEDAVIGVADERPAEAGVFLIEFVEDDVGEQRRKRAALRDAEAGGFKSPGAFVQLGRASLRRRLNFGLDEHCRLRVGCFVRVAVLAGWEIRASRQRRPTGSWVRGVSHHSAAEEIGDEVQHAHISHALGQAQHQADVIDVIEKAFNVEIDHPAASGVQVILRHGHGILRGAFGTIGKAVGREMGFPQGREDLREGLEHEPVAHSGDAEGAGAA